MDTRRLCNTKRASWCTSRLTWQGRGRIFRRPKFKFLTPGVRNRLKVRRCNGTPEVCTSQRTKKDSDLFNCKCFSPCVHCFTDHWIKVKSIEFNGFRAVGLEVNLFKFKITLLILIELNVILYRSIALWMVYKTSFKFNSIKWSVKSQKCKIVDCFYKKMRTRFHLKLNISVPFYWIPKNYIPFDS